MLAAVAEMSPLFDAASHKGKGGEYNSPERNEHNSRHTMPGKMDGKRRIVSGKIDKATTAAKMRPKCTMKLTKRRKNTKKRSF